MQMLYNSDNFAVVQFEVSPSETKSTHRGGYEIVDKFARREIFIDGLMALQFKADVEDLIRGEPSEEEVDAFLERFAGMAQQPVILH
jgi:hypothetical protein